MGFFSRAEPRHVPGQVVCRVGTLRLDKKLNKITAKMSDKTIKPMQKKLNKTTAKMSHKTIKVIQKKLIICRSDFNGFIVVPFRLSLRRTFCVVLHVIRLSFRDEFGGSLCYRQTHIRIYPTVCTCTSLSILLITC